MLGLIDSKAFTKSNCTQLLRIIMSPIIKFFFNVQILLFTLYSFVYDSGIFLSEQYFTVRVRNTEFTYNYWILLGRSAHCTLHTALYT